MEPASPNRHVLEAVASKLEPVIDDLVFVGGQVVELLLTDPAAVRIRATIDVDVVVAGTRSDYHRMEDRLRELGFTNDTSDGAPICRWRTEDGYVLDLMPADETVTRLLEQMVCNGAPRDGAEDIVAWSCYHDSTTSDLCRDKARCFSRQRASGPSWKSRSRGRDHDHSRPP